MRKEVTLLMSGVEVGSPWSAEVVFSEPKYAQAATLRGRDHTITMTAKWPGALSFFDIWFDWPPIKLTLADAVRLQSVLWHSFVTWYATGEVTGKMFKL